MSSVVLNSAFIRWLGIIAVAALAACGAIFSLSLMTPARPLDALLPTRTPTRRPPPTITPVAYPPTPPAVLADDFSTRDNFPRTSGVKLPFGYDSGTYRLAPPLDVGFVRVLNQTFLNKTYLNLSLDARVAPDPGSPPLEYGVLFWHSEDSAGQERFLAFTVNSHSTVRLLAYEPITSTEQGKNAFQFTEIVPATYSAAIHLDGTPNRLRVDVHPRRLLAYVNDELVMDTDAKIISEWRLRLDFDGRVGMLALSQEPGAQVHFTQFDIYADGKAE